MARSFTYLDHLHTVWTICKSFQVTSHLNVIFQ